MPSREGDTITQTGKYREEPLSLVIPKHFDKVVVASQMESLLVRAMSEYWGSEGLKRGPVFGDQVNVVAEERAETDGEHGSHKKHEEHMKLALHRASPLSSPEVDEIAEGNRKNHDTVQERIREKQDKEFVVVEANAIVHPSYNNNKINKITTTTNSLQQNLENSFSNNNFIHTI
jgi:hypothetical protein